MTKLFTVFKTEIHDHHIIIGVFAFFIGITYLNEDHDNKNNCYLLEPDITCSGQFTVSRQSIVNNATTMWVFESANYTAYHLDEFREVNGFAHVECPPNNDTCTLHYDIYNGVVGFDNIFGTVGHAAETIDRICLNSNLIVDGFSPNIYGCQGLPDWITVILIWAAIIFIPYYGIKHAGLFVFHIFKKE
jgi:hypothetical protein